MNRELRVLMIAAALTFAALPSAQAELSKRHIEKVQQLIKSGDFKGLNRFINNNNWIFNGETILEQALVQFSENLMLKKPVQLTEEKWLALVAEAGKASSIY